MPPTGEDRDDAETKIDVWSVIGAVLLGAGFVIHMMFTRMRDGSAPGLHRRLQFFFILLGGVGIIGIALAGLARMRKPKPDSPAAQDVF